jgi:hypothetical protein
VAFSGYNTHIPGYGKSRAKHYRKEAAKREAAFAINQSSSDELKADKIFQEKALKSLPVLNAS